jgi:hypothetical protein
MEKALIMAQVPQPEDFVPHVHKLFRFDGAPHALRLASVDVPDLQWPPNQRKPFSLIFQGPRGDVMPEGFYAADVEDGPRFEFYIIPIHTPAPGRQDYQVVFN